MARAYQIVTICEVYNAACDQSESILGELQSERAVRMEHEQAQFRKTRDRERNYCQARLSCCMTIGGYLRVVPKEPHPIQIRINI